MHSLVFMLTNMFDCCRYAAGDYAGQILQQCMDMIRYQPPATNLTVPTSAGYGDNVTPGAVTGREREHELWARGLQVMLCNLHLRCLMMMYLKDLLKHLNTMFSRKNTAALIKLSDFLKDRSIKRSF